MGGSEPGVGLTLSPIAATPVQQRLEVSDEPPSNPLARPHRFEQEPGAAFGFIDPGLEQAGAGNVAAFVAQGVRLPHMSCQLFVVFEQLGQHIEGGYIVGIVVGHALQARDLAD
jgi:hypothetical protein